MTIVAGRGGVGKSLHAWQIGVATVMGIPFPPWSAPVRPRRVLVLSGEDDADEIERRVAAACQSMGVERSALGSDFLVWTKRSIRLATKHPQSGATSLTQLWQLVRWAVVNQDIGLVIIDPLIKSSSGFKESDIDDMEELFGILRSLTDGYECAVLVDDHFAKAGQGGDQAGVRGASSKVDASRITITMTAMSTKEWKDIKPPGPPETYISIVDPKQNYGPKHASSWSQLVSYPVGNGEERPALQAVNLAAGQDFLDPSTWAHRIAFLRLIMEGRDEEAGQKGWPWCSAQKGPQGARLDCAMVNKGDLTSCMMCSTPIRFEHHMRRPEAEPLVVGCICSVHMSLTGHYPPDSPEMKRALDEAVGVERNYRNASKRHRTLARTLATDAKELDGILRSMPRYDAEVLRARVIREWLPRLRKRAIKREALAQDIGDAHIEFFLTEDDQQTHRKRVDAALAEAQRLIEVAWKRKSRSQLLGWVRAPSWYETEKGFRSISHQGDVMQVFSNESGGVKVLYHVAGAPKPVWGPRYPDISTAKTSVAKATANALIRVGRLPKPKGRCRQP